MNLHRLAFYLLLGMNIVSLLGCGGPKLGKVSGVVMVDGKPLTQGQMTFYPEYGRAALGQIQADGSYQLTTFNPNDGALVGKHRVTIQATKVSGGSVVKASSLEDEFRDPKTKPNEPILVPGVVTWLVPKKVSELDTTDLSVAVVSGQNIHNFTLPAP